MIPVKIKKYLQKYGINKWSLTTSNDAKYNAVIVVPALDEYENLKKLLTSLSSCNRDYLIKTLIIIVINNVEDCSETLRVNNSRTLEYLNQIIDRKKCGDEFIGYGPWPVRLRPTGSTVRHTSYRGYRK